MASKDKNKFIDFKRLVKSFKYAIAGLKSSLDDEQNIKIHFIAAFLVLILNIVLKVNVTEWIITIFLCGLVISAELFNTAIEYVVDLATNKIEEKAKLAKDISAGAVLSTAITSLIIGFIIYIPKIIELIGGLKWKNI